MTATRKPGLLALIACLAVLVGYCHQLFGQFEHHHLGTPVPHHDDGAHHDHHGCHDHAPAPTPDEKAPCPSGEDSESCHQCHCAMIPALTHTNSLPLPALTIIDTVPALALSTPGADARSIDHPPAA